MEKLLADIRECTVCKEALPHGPRPVIAANRKSKIAIIGQAPGMKVHQTGIPWDDPSGDRLRKWLGVSKDKFYDNSLMALVPMGFCYPGKGKSGDLPPRPECAPLWHQSLIDKMPGIQLVLLIGIYAQQYYLKKEAERNLTDTVRNYQKYLPNYFVLPHPSPRNRFWITKNPWFEKEVLPDLRTKVFSILQNE